MSHEFELAFILLDDAANRLHARHYGLSRIVGHPYGPILLTGIHRYTRAAGHHLSLLAADHRGQVAVVDATTPNLRTEPDLRIRTVRAEHLTFHAAHDSRTFRAAGRHRYTLSAHCGENSWSLTTDTATPTVHNTIHDAVNHVLAQEHMRQPITAGRRR